VRALPIGAARPPAHLGLRARPEAAGRSAPVRTAARPVAAGTAGMRRPGHRPALAVRVLAVRRIPGISSVVAAGGRAPSPELIRLAAGLALEVAGQPGRPAAPLNIPLGALAVPVATRGIKGQPPDRSRRICGTDSASAVHVTDAGAPVPGTARAPVALAMGVRKRPVTRLTAMAGRRSGRARARPEIATGLVARMSREGAGDVRLATVGAPAAAAATVGVLAATAEVAGA
jgi:hypothetical protein